MNHTATYSPEDNKLRITPAHRLSPEEYARVKAAGFAWAPKQGIFVAPMWTPAREDIALEFAGEIEDEDRTLMERAEERAERFDEYHDSRTKDATQARAAVARISDGIPLGQPILVGHHSERHARKDADRIENGMRKAVKAWETAEYWTRRAAAAVRHAEYKERPDVRARRIKTIEADRRKIQKNLDEHAQQARMWSLVDKADGWKPKEDGTPLTREERAYYIAGRISGGYVATGEQGQHWTAYDVLRPAEERYSACPAMTVDEVLAALQASRDRYAAHAARWIAHYDNRLAYERAMLAESGYIEPPKKPTKAVLPILNYAGEVQYSNPYTRETVTTQAHGITSAEWAAINKDYKGTRISADGTHRVRTALIKHALMTVYLTDAKQHPKPTGETPTTRDAQKVAERVEKAQAIIQHQTTARAAIVQHNRELIDVAPRTPYTPPPADIQAMKQAIKTGVHVVAVPQLFPTPAPLAARMVELADIKVHHRVLEPSAGTGAIWRELSGKRQAVEINPRLADALREMCTRADDVICADFLQLRDLGRFDRILMNPPFENGADIKHIQHAYTLLAEGGRLVAICANGPRQRAALQPLADHWEDLPAGTFAEQGTQVNTALLVINR